MNVSEYRQVRLFSPWLYDIDRAARALLETTAWSAPNDDYLPTAGEVADDYLVLSVGRPALAPHIQIRGLAAPQSPAPPLRAYRATTIRSGSIGPR